VDSFSINSGSHTKGLIAR